MNAAVKRIDQRNVHITLRVNGEEVEVSFAPYKTLLEVLREDLNLTGTKHGCELGECGTCTVQVDGVPILSCLSLAVDAVGKDVRTVEGLAQGSELLASFLVRKRAAGLGEGQGEAGQQRRDDRRCTSCSLHYCLFKRCPPGRRYPTAHRHHGAAAV